MPTKAALLLLPAQPRPRYLLHSSRRQSRVRTGRVGPEHGPGQASPLLSHSGHWALRPAFPLAWIQSASQTQLIFYAFLISQGQCYHPKLTAIFSLRSWCLKISPPQARGVEYTPGFLQRGVPLQLAQQGVKKELRRKRKPLEVIYILQTSFCHSQTGFFPEVLVRDFGTNVHCELGYWGVEALLLV